jgi:hypothetical protein
VSDPQGRGQLRETQLRKTDSRNQNRETEFRKSDSRNRIPVTNLRNRKSGNLIHELNFVYPIRVAGKTPIKILSHDAAHNPRETIPASHTG